VLSGSTLRLLLLAGSSAWIAWLIRSRSELVHAGEKTCRP